MIGMPGAARARQVDTPACTTVASASLCRGVADMASVMTIRGPAIAAAGSPVPATASTLGLRMPGRPRLAFAARRTRGSADLPVLAGAGSSTSVTAWTGAVAAGLSDGFSPWPTVGGLLSVDLLATASLLQLPSADGFRTRSPASWAVGARVGILRESFTLPGVSVSAMYRRTGRTTFGDIGLETRAFHVRIDRVDTWSARLTAGKRVGPVGLTGGAGWDHHASRGRFRVPSADGTPVEFRFRDHEAGRRSFFVGASWTRLVFNFSGELGWQPAAASDGPAAGAGGGFLGLAVRLTY